MSVSVKVRRGEDYKPWKIVLLYSWDSMPNTLYMPSTFRTLTWIKSPNYYRLLTTYFFTYSIFFLQGKELEFYLRKIKAKKGK